MELEDRNKLFNFERIPDFEFSYIKIFWKGYQQYSKGRKAAGKNDP